MEIGKYTMMTIQLVPSAIVKIWCVYILCEPSTNEILYVGTAELNNVFRFNDVWKNARFDQNKSYKLTIVESANDRNDATNKKAAYLKTLAAMPSLNRYSSLTDRRPEVLCNETGERFANASKCAQAHGLGYPNLINHLALKPGFKSVKGRTYQYDRKPTTLPEPRTFDRT